MTYRKVLGAVAAFGFAVCTGFAQMHLANPFSAATETNPESPSLGVSATQGLSFNIDSGRLLDSDPQNTSLLGSLDGPNPSRTWTLSLSELDSGPDGTRMQRGLVVTATPEPSTLALLGLGGVVVIHLLRRHGSKKPRGN